MSEKSLILKVSLKTYGSSSGNVNELEKCSGYETAFLHSMLLPKLPSMELQNTLSIVMVFHIALLLINKLISQKVKCSNGLVLMEFNGLTVFSTILK